MKTEPEFKCPECGKEAWTVFGVRGKNKLNIVCALGHRNTIATPDGWKPKRVKIRPQTRGFY
jgi:hypothetical protein